jgi:hypothetical protein
MAEFQLSHLDRQPMGDIAGVIAMTISTNPDKDFVFSYVTDSSEFHLDSRDVKNELEGIPIENPSVYQFLKEMINENLQNINALG